MLRRPGNEMVLYSVPFLLFGAGMDWVGWFHGMIAFKDIDFWKETGVFLTMGLLVQ